MNIKICQLDFLKLKLSEKNHFLMNQVVNDQGRFKTIPVLGDYFCAHCLMEPVTWWTNGTDNQEADTSGHKRSNTIFLQIHIGIHIKYKQRCKVLSIKLRKNYCISLAVTLHRHIHYVQCSGI